MTATYAPAADQSRAPSRLVRSFAGPIATLVIFVAWFVAVTVTGSPIGDVVRWVAVVAVAVLAPGWALVRVSRRAVAPLIEDVAWAAPAGCLVAMTGWFLDRVLPFAAGAYGLGPLLVVLALVVPWSRRRVLARPGPGWGPGPVLVIGLVQLIALGWMLNTGLAAWRPDPGPRGTVYVQDLMYGLDLVGELKHHLIPTYPPVAGTTLSYHWFYFAIAGHLTTHTGVDTFDASLRLGPATLVPAVLLLVAVVARRIANRVWAGPVAAVLLGAVDLSQGTRWTTEDGSINVLPRAWLGNPPQNLGWLAGLAAAGTVIAFLRRAPEDRAMPGALLVPFLILAAGSKSPDVAVIGAGLALACLVQVIRRAWPQAARCLLAGLLCLAVFGLASITIYAGSSYGLRFRWFGTVLNRVPSMFPGYATRVTPHYLGGLRYSRVALLTEAVLWGVPLLPRVAGLLFQVRYRARDPVSWFCLGTVCAGFLFTLLLQHPAMSEIYFAQSAYPIGIAGAAAGLCFAAERVRAAYPGIAARHRTTGLFAALVGVGFVGAALIVYAQPTIPPTTRWQLAHPGQPIASAVSVWRLAWEWLHPLVWLVCLVVAGAAFAVLAARRWLRRPAVGRAPVAALAAVSTALGTGMFTLTLFFHGAIAPVAGSRAFARSYESTQRANGVLPTMRDAFAAGAYVDAHAGPNDVVATNMYCRASRAARAGGSQPCDARDFGASALTERRTLVGGWAYADRVVDAAWAQRTLRYNDEPFWDEPLLREQFASFAHPTTAILDDLYRHHHVRWIFVDLRDGPVDTAALDRLAVRRFVGPSTGVWQLKPPAG